ncbi:hypothetical protein PPN31114_00295 [Pandoraea pneumonica]|uniref:Uncharacterized protein n=1 Tax=Pandoraea pneumonica TaxID=2508299 RepID=A0A5E4RN70_9BURK|nr:hypothetical protein [Pandoraea pneumonica]VVD64860.1 hypothetical protein PPN31114_00295 [Pandoraea pneumonica]
MKVIADEGNLVETAALARRFAHDEFARTIGVEVLAEGDIANFLLDRLASMRFTPHLTPDLTPHHKPNGALIVQRVHACVYAMPMVVQQGDAQVIEVRLAVVPQVQHGLATQLVISKD